MKKIIQLSFLALCLGIASVGNAQTAKKVGHSVSHAAKKVGNKTAEVASKGKSKVANTTVKDKMGPNGETIYMDKYSKYYWVDKKGRNHYIPAEALKNKM
ncbi:MAG: hypothetical protein JWP88_1544 [Flaviaesturariibacter sp.]|nr:hypothetical protein [Flaviaesturariibacter sp.]